MDDMLISIAESWWKCCLTGWILLPITVAIVLGLARMAEHCVHGVPVLPMCGFRHNGTSWDNYQNSSVSRICATLLLLVFLAMWFLIIALTISAVLLGLLNGLASPFFSPVMRMEWLQGQIFSNMGIIFCVIVGLSTFLPRMILLSVIPGFDGSIPIVEDVKHYRKLWKERRAAREAAGK